MQNRNAHKTLQNTLNIKLGNRTHDKINATFQQSIKGDKTRIKTQLGSMPALLTPSAARGWPAIRWQGAPDSVTWAGERRDYKMAWSMSWHSLGASGLSDTERADEQSR